MSECGFGVIVVCSASFCLMLYNLVSCEFQFGDQTNFHRTVSCHGVSGCDSTQKQLDPWYARMMAKLVTTSRFKACGAIVSVAAHAKLLREGGRETHRLRPESSVPDRGDIGNEGVQERSVSQDESRQVKEGVAGRGCVIVYAGL